MNSRMASSAASKLVRLRTQRPRTISQFGRGFGQGNPLATSDLHSVALGRTDEEEKKRHYHTTVPSERAAALIMGLATVSALAFAGSSAVNSYNEWKAAQPSPEELEAQRKDQEKEQEAEQAERVQTEAKQKEETKKESSKPRENIFKEWFGVGVGAKYYEGGFEDTMTKKEAALVLGVRESSSPQRIKGAHRKLLVLNHPDTGGSTYIAGKINEAKELLLKGKARV